jgi:catechol 2,3-dioxygenase-like lactoylglutathione lyase family enzyme
MRATTGLTLTVVLTLAAALSTRAAADTTAPFLAQDSMNVFRRFAVERPRMLEFYGEALGLAPMSSFNVGGQGGMSRFLVGTSQLKFTTAQRGKTYPSGDVRAVRGLRVWTFFFTDEQALTSRLTQHGFGTPMFTSVGTTRRALIADPDGQWVELVVTGPGDTGARDRIEVGITAGDVERSRAFYRDFVGLEELPPVQDPLLGTTKYPFRHGTTTINLWAAAGANPASLPTNSGAAGIQYVVNNVEAVNALAQSRHVAVEQPLADTLPGLRTVWLFDPDGVTNYFAQLVPRRGSTSN